MELSIKLDEDKLKELCNQIVEQIKSGELQIQEGPAGKWCPFPKEKPVTEGEYLVTTEDHIIYIDWWTFFESDQTYDINGHFTLGNSVIAWMPLPPAYKEGDENEQNKT